MYLAAISTALNRRTFDRAIGTENTAISVLRLEDDRATLAVVVILTGVGRHPLIFAVPAKGAGNYGIFDHARR